MVFLALCGPCKIRRSHDLALRHARRSFIFERAVTRLLARDRFKIPEVSRVHCTLERAQLVTVHGILLRV